MLAGGPLGIMQAASTWCCPMCMSASSSASRSASSSSMQGKLADMYVDAECGARLCLCGGAGPATAARPRARMRRAPSCSRPRRRRRSRSMRSSSWAATAISTTIRPGACLRDAKLYEIGAGTSEIRRMLIGRELFTKSGWGPRLAVGSRREGHAAKKICSRRSK